MTDSNDIEIVEGDLSADFARRVRQAGSFACDTETSGLDWKVERLAICQLALPGGEAAILRVAATTLPHRLVDLLTDSAVKKVFHHAMFDLRFMVAAWRFEPASIACTKVASKLLFPDRKSHSLQPLLAEFLGVTIHKAQQKSDWFSPNLTRDQIEYALGDVRHLHDLYDRLANRLAEKQLLHLARRCFEHLPGRVELELKGYEDVYSY